MQIDTNFVKNNLKGHTNINQTIKNKSMGIRKLVLTTEWQLINVYGYTFNGLVFVGGEEGRRREGKKMDGGIQRTQTWVILNNL